MSDQRLRLKIGTQTKEYGLVVLRVTKHDEHGRPSEAVIGYDDTTFDLSDDNVSREFMTAFVPIEMMVMKPKQ